MTGRAPTNMAIWSATSTQVSSAPTSHGRYRLPSPSLSIASQMSSSGTWVPVWSGEESRVAALNPGPGASMMPAGISARRRPSVPVERPLASTAARMSRKVYVAAPAALMTPGFSPRASSTSMYWGSSVV